MSRDDCERAAAGQAESVLFVAHRKEILRQSLLMFRQVMRDETFGELYVDGPRCSWA